MWGTWTNKIQTTAINVIKNIHTLILMCLHKANVSWTHKHAALEGFSRQPERTFQDSELPLYTQLWQTFQIQTYRWDFDRVIEHRGGHQCWSEELGTHSWMCCHIYVSYQCETVIILLVYTTADCTQRERQRLTDIRHSSCAAFMPVLQILNQVNWVL